MKNTLATKTESNQNFWPYVHYSLKLTAKPRKGGGNMFRHQMETMAILLNYGFTQPVLLKAALIHDIIEDADVTGFYGFEEIEAIDNDGPIVMALVQEVSQRNINGVLEPKGEFLSRIMINGSKDAKILKMADRISNLSSLPCSGEIGFITSYLAETEKFILPFAGQVNTEMKDEISNRIETIKKFFQL